MANPGASATNSGTATTTIQNGTSAALAFSASDTNSLTLSPTGDIPVGVLDSPIVDSSAETIYTFFGRNPGSTTNAGVNQLKISSNTITSGQTGATVTIGTSSLTVPVFAGTFDNKYFTATSSTSPSGNLYVCGDPGGDPILYQVPISSNAFGTVVTGPTLTTVSTTCSPVTELCNPGTGTCANTPTGNAVDWLFLSVRADAVTARASSCKDCKPRLRDGV